MLRKVVLFSLCVFSLNAFAAGGDFHIRTEKLSKCAGGRAYIATFNFNDPEFTRHHGLMVLAEGFMTFSDALRSLWAKGLVPVALINGGFFETGGTKIYSYYKSSVNGYESPSNSVWSPRACTMFDRQNAAFNLLQSTDENYALFQQGAGLEVFCAGPQLVENGVNVAQRQYCNEHFDPACRPDHDDPGIGINVNTARSASCITADGQFKLFSFTSSISGCGATLPILAEWMIAEGCVNGMNHDGGGSSKIYLDNSANEPVYAAGYGSNQKRRIPVWLAIVKR